MSDMFAEVMPHPLVPKTKDGQRQMIMLTSVSRDAEGGNAEKRIVPVTFTTGSEDRHGSVFNPDGWDFSGFKRNPVVLWSHMTKIPMIANALDLRRDGSAWRANLQFAEEEWAAGGGFNLAAVIHRLMDANKLRAMSHGFIPKLWTDRQATTIPSFMAENVRYENQELTEMSPVNVPSNRDSVRSAIGEGILSGVEADFLLDFGFSLHADAPIEIRSLPKAEEPEIVLTDDDAATRAGAVLNKNNHAKLKQVHAMLSEVLDSAKKAEDDPADEAPRTWTEEDLHRALTTTLKIGGAPSGSDATLQTPDATGTATNGNPSLAPTPQRGYLHGINVRLDDLT